MFGYDNTEPAIDDMIEYRDDDAEPLFDVPKNDFITICTYFFKDEIENKKVFEQRKKDILKHKKELEEEGYKVLIKSNVKIL